VHGNLMVDVQATNAKLRARAERIVMQATGIDAAAASAALESVGGSVKAAILVTSTGVTPQEAIARLATHDGVLRDALAGVAAAKVAAGTRPASPRAEAALTEETDGDGP